MKLTNLDKQEYLKYKKGTAVELKEKPGKIYLIEEYDEMMVPPIWLVNDPKPHYPDEFNLIPNVLRILPFKKVKVA